MENRNDRHYPVSAIRICIDTYDGDIRGRIYSKMYGEALPFENCGEMFLRADRLFDACGYPQSFQEKRGFQEARGRGNYARPKIRLEDAQIRSQRGKVGTVDVLVRSRRRAGWQGSVLSEDGGVSADFESELELLRYFGIDRKTKQGRQKTDCREEGCER